MRNWPVVPTAFVLVVAALALACGEQSSVVNKLSQVKRVLTWLQSNPSLSNY